MKLINTVTKWKINSGAMYLPELSRDINLACDSSDGRKALDVDTSLKLKPPRPFRCCSLFFGDDPFTETMPLPPSLSFPLGWTSSPYNGWSSEILLSRRRRRSLISLSTVDERWWRYFCNWVFSALSMNLSRSFCFLGSELLFSRWHHGKYRS